MRVGSMCVEVCVFVSAWAWRMKAKASESWARAACVCVCAQPEALVLGCAASHAGVRLGLSGREEWEGRMGREL